jgi:peptidoglycan-N-acetylglucosamine deacetylase
MRFFFKSITIAGKIFFPSLLWNLPVKEKEIYLSFDDGPISEVTPWVLSLLKNYNAKATFFCIGDNIKSNPEIFQQILSEGHTVGNHTFNHLNGWKTPSEEYLQDTLQTEKLLSENIAAYQQPHFVKTITTSEENKPFARVKLFRPPYGKLKFSQMRKLKKQGFKIVMWDVISGDFNENLPAKSCYKFVIEMSKPGSIIVFHDSLKARKNLKEVLPKVLNYFSKRGYKFRAL